MSDETRTTDLEQAFVDPQKGENDMGKWEMNSLPDKIAADKYLKDSDVGKATGSKKRFLGVMLRKIGFPGTVH